MSKPIFFLLGPSASGKTEVSILLAKRLGAEIISADSMLVYRGMDIGTAKPTADQLKEVRHHLIDIVPPRKNFSVFEHRRRALEKIEDILKRGKIPLIVGASGLYVEALWKGLSDYPAGNSKLRQKLIREARQKGTLALYQKLKAKDPVRASQIHPNDQKRIIRALEISRSKKRDSKKESLEDKGYAVFAVGLARDRQDLYDRINQRVEQMFQKGFVQEVQRLCRSGFSKTAKQALGYKEILEHLKNNRGRRRRVNLLLLIQDIQKHTRQFAKRQLTWLRKQKEIHWVFWKRGESAETVCDKIIKEYEERGFA